MINFFFVIQKENVEKQLSINVGDVCCGGVMNCLA